MYKTLLSLLMAIPLFFSMSCFGDCCNECNDKPGRTNNCLSPVLRLTGTPCLLSQDLGVSFMGELGSKNYRIAGTFGGNTGLLSNLDRFKISAEFLSQKLGYRFATGTLHRWVNQYAVGAGYQYLIPTCYDWSSWISSVDFNITYSQAFSRHIKSAICAQNLQTLEIPTLLRNVAGGDNAHLNIGATLLPWSCAQILVGVDYDYTYYKRKYQHNIWTSGVGATVWYNQMLGNNFDFDCGAEFRRPFNYYAAALKWNSSFSQGNFSIGVFASYTHGKNLVPNNTMCGVSIDFTFGGGPLFTNNYIPCCGIDCYCVPTYADCQCDSQLLAWLVKPAVYMPTVLAVADQAFTFHQGPSPCPICPICPPPCTPPTSTPFLNDQQEPITSDNPLQIPVDNPTSYDAGAFFTGNNLTFSISPTVIGVTINSSTGVVTFDDSPLFGARSFTITGSNSCGSIQQILWVFFQGA